MAKNREPRVTFVSKLIGNKWMSKIAIVMKIREIVFKPRIHSPQTKTLRTKRLRIIRMTPKMALIIIIARSSRDQR
jgi:hypothetical protein